MEISREEIPFDFCEPKTSAVQDAIAWILKYKIIFVCVWSKHIVNSGDSEKETPEQ